MSSITSRSKAGHGEAVLICVAAATCLALIVFCAPLTTASATVASLGGGVALQAWVLSAMPLGAAAGLLCAGAMGDALGRREVFIGGLWLTTAASALAALAPTGSIMVAGRILQGLGCAGLLACGLGLLAEAYEGPARARAARIWAASLGAGVALGPLLCAILLELSGWRAAYWSILALSLALSILAMRVLPVTRGQRQRVDYLGSLLLIMGLVPILAALIQVRSGVTVQVAVLTALGVIFLIGFILRERQAANPILMLQLFRNRDFVSATTGAFASGAGVLAIMASVPVILQQGYHLNAIGASLVILAWSALTAVTALFSGKLTHGLAPRTVLIAALLGCTLGQALLLFIREGSGWESAIAGLVIAGVSNGILNASLGHQAVESVPADKAAMGSGANNTARYLGSAIGFALIAMLVAHGLAQGDLFLGWDEAVLTSVGFSLAGLCVVFSLKPPKANQG
ncbi:MFS transporter [Donghicola mangrovi]|uniref:MFS transporter n=1 Tax=Donghicola mangrovi TaxID=2729614 RepID=A0A850QHC3_9RHOB|nr:MFS transporter [Donghicola mangrovi]NVO25449.1 MFS transporter [Donghicola mangrovi]